MGGYSAFRWRFLGFRSGAEIDLLLRIGFLLIGTGTCLRLGQTNKGLNCANE